MDLETALGIGQAAGPSARSNQSWEIIAEALGPEQSLGVPELFLPLFHSDFWALTAFSIAASPRPPFRSRRGIRTYGWLPTGHLDLTDVQHRPLELALLAIDLFIRPDTHRYLFWERPKKRVLIH